MLLFTRQLAEHGFVGLVHALCKATIKLEDACRELTQQSAAGEKGSGT